MTKIDEDDPYGQGPVPANQDPALTKTSRPTGGQLFGDVLAGAANVATLFPGIKNILSGGNQNAAQSAYQNALNALIANSPQELASLIPQLQLQMVQGTITPAQAQAVLAEQSRAAGITPNPEATRAQFESLNQLQKIVQEGGLTAIDRAKLNEIRNQINTQNRGNQLALQNEFQSRGLGGSGLELASRLVADQGAANRAADQSTDVAALQQQRALQAILSSGELGGKIREQGFNEDIQKARAQDSINQLNAQLASQANLANASNAQRSNELNLQNQQNVANANTQIKNQNSLIPLNVRQQENADRNAYGANLSSAYRNQGAQLQTQADKTTKQNTSTVNNLVNNAPKYVETAKTIWDIGKSIFSDENKKENKRKLSDQDVDAIISKLTGYKFNYKDDPAQNPQVGIMAQDMEKTPMKDSVVNTDQGKILVQNDNDDGMKWAVISNMANRIKNLEGK